MNLKKNTNWKVASKFLNLGLKSNHSQSFNQQTKKTQTLIYRVCFHDLFQIIAQHI